MKILFFLLFISVIHRSFSQVKDTLNAVIIRDTKKDSSYVIYKITLRNFTKSPVCVLHSIFINLFNSAPQQLALYNKNDQFYSLSYSANDTLYDYEGPIINFNGEIILPLQQIEFKISVPFSELSKKLQFDYFFIPDFCYLSFKKDILKNATKWHRKYKRSKKWVELPL